MNREEEGPSSPDPDLHGNHGDQVFKVSHPKPICPRCGKKAVTFYIRGNKREYLPMGYYCNQCDEPVKPMSAVPPRVFRMSIEEFLHTTSERYDVILGDPAWTYDVEAVRPEDRISSHYHQMSTQEICDLPVQNIANKNSYLFLWVTSPKLNDGLKVLQSWGFDFLTSIAWDKELMGLGHVVRTQHELILIGRRGHPTPPALKFRSVIREKRTDHSRKPEKSYEIINSMFPEAKKIELFARWVHQGWTGVGNEAEVKPEKVHAKNQKKCMQKFEVEVI